MQITTFFLILLAVHLLITAVFVILIKSDVMIVSSQGIFLILFLPFWGILITLAAEIISRNGYNGKKSGELYQFILEDSDYHKIGLSQENTVNEVVPVEEAIIINDSKTRREFMMDIIGADSDSYTSLLQKARFSNDIEVAHYASTAIMEIQRDYEMKILKAKEIYSQDEDNLEFLGNYILTLKNYIGSGLIEESILRIQRQRYHQMLIKRAMMPDAQPEDFYDAIDNQIELGDVEEATEILNLAISKWPNLEEILILEIKLCFLQNDGEKIKKAINRMNKSEIFLSSEAREIIAFWSGKNIERDVTINEKIKSV